MEGVPVTSDIIVNAHEYYDQNLLVTAYENSVWTKYGQVRDIPEKSGKAITFRRYVKLPAATTPLTKGVTPAGRSMSYADLTVTVYQYGDYIMTDDEVEFTSIDPVLDKASEELGEQAALTLDTLMKEKLMAGTTRQWASTATQDSEVTNVMRFTKAEAYEAAQTLRGNLARPITKMMNPQDIYGTVGILPAFIGFIGNDTLSYLENNASANDFVTPEKYSAQTELLPFECGKIGPIRLIFTENPAVEEGVGNNGIDLQNTIIVGRDSYGVTRIAGHALENIIQPLGSGGANDPLKQRATTGWKATFAGEILNEAHVVVVIHY